MNAIVCMSARSKAIFIHSCSLNSELGRTHAHTHTYAQRVCKHISIECSLFTRVTIETRMHAHRFPFITVSLNLGPLSWATQPTDVRLQNTCAGQLPPTTITKDHSETRQILIRTTNPFKINNCDARTKWALSRPARVRLPVFSSSVNCTAIGYTATQYTVAEHRLHEMSAVEALWLE